MSPLQLAYCANILILAPIALPTLLGIFPTDQHKFPHSPGWRIIVGSFWCAILALSVMGLFNPLVFSPLLLLQLIY
jgi:hypothetical protein